MKPTLLVLGLFALLIAAALVNDSLRTVKEGHHGLQLRMGRIVNTDESLPPGLHVIRPITDEIIQINTEVRMHEFNNRTINWRVTYPRQYYSTTGNDESRMNSSIERLIARLPAGKEIADLNLLLRANFGVEIVSIE